MDYHEILLYLTTIEDKTEDGLINDFNERLQQILQKVQTISMRNNGKLEIIDTVDSKNEPNDVRYQYVRTIVHVLQNIKINNSANDESLYSVQQFRTLKSSVELITAIGIISCLLPGVGVDMAKTCPKAVSICKEEPTDLQKYERLKFTVNSLAQLYNDEITYRPAILAQIGPLLAALLQLCHAPLTKPSTKPQATSIREGNANDKDKFTMTADLYDELKRDQEHFACLFHELLSKCPSSTCVKELMVILGIAEAPKWLRRETRKYLTEQLVRPNGIASFVDVVCEDALDLGQHWHKFDIISRLIVTSHGANTEQYYKSICSQLLSLLTSTQIKYSTVANCCIVALYEYNSNVCRENIVAVMRDPLLVNPENEQKVTRKSEEEVERCIEKLTRCFVVTEEASSKRLPPQLLTNVAVPLFSLYNDVRQSACALKSKLKQLVLLLLHEESTRNDLFRVFLGHGLTNNFGNRLEAKLGPTGGIEIVGTDKKPCKYEELADTLFDLTLTTDVLATELFSYLSKYLSNSMKLEDRKEGVVQAVLEDTERYEKKNDTLEKMEEKLAAVKLLSSLANISAVREAQIEDPKSLMYLVRSLFDRYIGGRLQTPCDNSSTEEDDDREILYVGLMLMNMILSERENKPLDWTVFSDFVKFLKERCRSNISSQSLLSLTRELIELIETNRNGKSERKRYQDLSVDRKASNKFEEALADLADPLLPVRAHGLVVLTKLIESMDPHAIARKTVLLHLFNENLKHEDSFIYLAAINGLCALATSYPQVVVETLVKEYIDMPQRSSCSPEQITTETRVKLGEVLVKLTRNLGELAPAYKNTLINGFLCAARDTDSLVRASSLSCLAELCKVLGFRLGDIVIEIIYCISCIIKTDRAAECRRAAVMVGTLLFRGLGKSTLTSLGRDLVDLYRGLKYLRDNDEDLALRLHAQLAVEELDSIVQDFLLSSSKLEKRIIL